MKRPLRQSIAPWISVGLLLVSGCAPTGDDTVMDTNDPAIPDTPITEGEQAAGREEPGNDYSEPYEGIDGDVSALAPPVGSIARFTSGETSAVVDAVTACRPAQGYNRGTPTNICVVTVDGKLVEYRTAEAFQAMRADAARSGVRISIVSGFRTMDQQRYLYNLYLSGRGNLAARPGYSNHQSGLALDLNTSSSGVLNWLNNNGSRYGFRRTVPSEAWHWERPAGSAGGAAPTSSGTRSDSSCWSSTLGRSAPNRTCVQSRADSQWYQCDDGAWYAGRGNRGSCTSSHALPNATQSPQRQTCYSATYGAELPMNICIQSRLDRLWYQCTPIGWVQGTSISSSRRGYSGACSGYRPL